MSRAARLDLARRFGDKRAMSKATLPIDAALPDLIEQRSGNALTLRWQVPGDGPFPLPIDVEIDGVLHTLPMTSGSGSIAVRPEAHIVIDPMAWLLRRSPAIERMQAPRVATP